MSQSIREILSTNIRKYREDRHFSMEELSLLLEVDNSYISKLEKSKINITIDKLEKLAQILGIEVVDLFKQ